MALCDQRSLEERDKMIDTLLFKVQYESGFNATEEQLDRYEAWLLMQKDFVLVNKIAFFKKKDVQIDKYVVR